MSLTLTRLRHGPRFRRLILQGRERLTPGMMRLRFTSPEMAGFAAPGFDDHVRLFFPPPGAELPAPRQGEGRLVWPDPVPAARDFTPRRHDPERGILTIDFVLHEGGVASDWALHAPPGAAIGMGGPRGSVLIEGQADHEILLGDATALPAIARRLETLPGGQRAIVRIEVTDRQEELPLPIPPGVDLRWLHSGRGETLARWGEALDLPPGEVFVFCAGEAATVSRIRARLDALGHPEGLRRLANYWRAGTAG
ncbi:Siderophore-interacting protein [Rubellimicrobium thermophilum DSM 16684]|uniref:Siderophore-interacting protein n=1 Tax=Rubellimicrobium thermophilum DSM 16684 TaxID=1123069 RepID=S9S9D0_9RHOB|nr:siderophore-interacting protein [Rubellimicrobium thermophilum]EPX82874.1 Siderophore-interacting protein [Rubellimicrobium thermophilum DSM 16684]